MEFTEKVVDFHGGCPNIEAWPGNLLTEFCVLVLIYILRNIHLLSFFRKQNIIKNREIFMIL